MALDPLGSDENHDFGARIPVGPPFAGNPVVSGQVGSAHDVHDYVVCMMRRSQQAAPGQIG
jgi:hypothetical protein